ncbi:hypothetical protein BSKO_06814 [Bryopsis sp. KO-2023]|nr:hypothetical protein BSKO_06814 [Bryopsis sp. KO-2023]
MEEERKKHVPKTETEMIKQDNDSATLSRAKHLLEEELDDVKNMNQMILYSKCVTIRDAQIEEKKHMMLEAEESDRKLDLMMEIERLKALENYEIVEVQRAEERRRGAEVLSRQIEERAKERVKQEELRNRERIQMLKEIERLKEEEVQVQVRKKEAAAAMMEDVALANAEQVRRKELMKVREKEEEEMIAEYKKRKDIKEQAAAEEKERIAREKELEVARLRAQQEKAADKQAELDELRARRYQEAKEREWRAREVASKDRQEAIMLDLGKARAAQKAAKIRQLADMAGVEQREFHRVLEANRKKEDEELQQRATTVDANLKYKEELLAQMAANDHRRSKERQEQLEEGRQLLQATAKEKARLEAIKQKKLKELESAGVPGKYTAELQRKKVGKW